MFCVVCVVSWATWLMFSGVPLGVLCRVVVSGVPCPGQLRSCSLVCLPAAFCRLCGVLGHLASVHRCARPVRCVACVRRPVRLDSLSPVCPLGVLHCVCRVLGHLAPVPRCARSVCCDASAAFCATWLPFSGVLARCFVLRVRSAGPLGSCSLVCPLGVLCCVCGVPGVLAPVYGCARSGCCVACAVSLTT